MGKNAISAKIAEGHLFVIMGKNALSAKTAEALLIVIMGDDAVRAQPLSAERTRTESQPVI